MEPHKPEKLEQKRYRLISILSLVDQMVDRILFRPWQRVEIDNVMDHAGKTGWSPLPVGFYDVLTTFPAGVLATDCSAFDWTFPGWLVTLIPQIRLDQGCGHSPQFELAVKRRIAEVMGERCVIRLPDGSRYRQTRPGVMKSGWLLTISFNSTAQELLTLLAWSRAYSGPCPKLWSMGDDVLMAWPENLEPDRLVEELKRAGILAKFAEKKLEFAGFGMGRDGGTPYVEPLYPNKHKYLLAHVQQEQLEEVVTSYGLIYALARPQHKDWLEPYLRKYSRWPEATAQAWAYGLLGGATLLLGEASRDLFSLE